jgi:gliding motility-associated lipoprotein GldD
MKRRMKIKLVFLAFPLFGLFSCEQPYTPKPRGYFRIDLPKKEYILFDTTFPYSFEYPVYSNITGDPQSPNEKYWINLNFPSFKATVHISYKPVDGNLATYLEDAHTLVTKHIAKADAISDSLIIDRNKNLFGLAYTLEGNGAASPYQFFLTDSSSNFVRGALYFNTVPNNDSLEPVINFIKDDILYLIDTFNWKYSNKK